MPTQYNKPRVTIIIRTRNLAHYLGAALESVRNQSYQNWEALILDDASNDDTDAVAAPFVTKDQRFRYVKNVHRLGRSRNLNLGLSLARGTYISILDADDVWCSPHTLTSIMHAIERHPEVALVAVSVAEINERGHIVRHFPNLWCSHLDIKKRLLIENSIAQNAVCFRRQLALAVKGYDERLQYTEDYELWLRLALKGKVIKLSDVLAHYRIHRGSVGVRKRRSQIIEEMRVVWRYRAQYPHIVLALVHRVLNLVSSFIPKRVRRVLAEYTNYHQIRTRLVNLLTW